MNKPVVKNWMRYWASTLAVSGMLVVGACSTSQDRTSADNTTTTDRENVENTDVNANDDYATSETTTSEEGMTDAYGTTGTTTTETTTDTYGTTDTGTSTTTETDTYGTTTETGTATTTETNTDTYGATETETTGTAGTTGTTGDYSTSQAGTTTDTNSATVGDQRTASQQTNASSASTSTQSVDRMSGTYGGNTSIDRHIKKHADVNEAIEEALSQLSGTSQMAMQSGSQGNNMQGDQSMTYSDNAENTRENEQTGVTYDRMSNTGAEDQTDMSTTDTMSDDQATDTDLNQTRTTTDSMVNRDQEGAAYDRMNDTSGQTTDVDAEGTTTGTETDEYDEMTTSGVDRGVDAQNTTTEDLSGVDENGAPLGGIKEDNNDRTTTDQTGATYDRMNNAGAEESYMGMYDTYQDPSMELSEEERRMIEENRMEFDQRRQSMAGQMDQQLQAYYFPAVEARPDVNYSELIEEIKEEMRLPKEMEDAKMEGTVLLQLVIDEQGEVSSAEVVDGIITQVKEDGTTMSFMRLTDKAKEGVADEVENENLIEFSDEQKEQLKQSLSQEAQRVLQSREGNWQPATQDDKPVKMVMVMPLRFDIED
jgi:hypothetical protein